MKTRLLVSAMFVLGFATTVAAAPKDPKVLPNLFPFPNPSGVLRTFSTTGKLDMTGPFFQDLGTNGRTCVTCHQPGEAWSISAANVEKRFQESHGRDPLFRTNDGSNCNHDINTSTEGGRRDAYSLLRTRGLIRVALDVPAGAEFEVVEVKNPYGCNETNTLSMYRRPLPSTNLRFLSAVMWDSRESSTQTGTIPIAFVTYPGDLKADLAHQVVDATMGHAQGTTPPTAEQQQQIVDFEMALSTAQAIDAGAGTLGRGGAAGGPEPLLTQEFFIGINDPLGLNPFGTPFTPEVFTLFNNRWAHTADTTRQGKHRASILRGQTLFNSKTINITGVGGLNDVSGLPSLIPGTCGTCHDTPNVGHHSIVAPVNGTIVGPLNIGVSDVPGQQKGGLDTSYLPVIKLRNKVTGDEVSTTDPGRAMITGKWADIGKFKGPILRGLAARAPYFHNGSAKTLKDTIEFYNTRFNMGLTAQERDDLAAFLSAL
jgi:cytochrome c peroxidase